jgi:uncharacterized phage protein gp47/JayE
MVTIPKISDLYNIIKSSIETKLNVTIPSFGKNFLRAFAQVQAGELKLFYISVANVQKNIFVDTADSEEFGGTLERFGRVKLKRNPFPAVAGKYTVTLIGSIGAVVPIGTLWKSDDTSASPDYLFTNDTPLTFDATSETILLRCLTPGVEARLIVGNTLSLTGPIALVNTPATVTAENVVPQEKESLEEYRRKILTAFRLEPQGGSGSDYLLWSLEVQGVRNVYPYTKDDVLGYSNEVNLYIESDDANADYVADSTLRNAVKSSIEDATSDRPSRKPLGVNLINYATVTPRNITINVIGSDYTNDEKTEIFNYVKLKFSEIRPFVASIGVVEDKNSTLNAYKIGEMIANAIPGKIFTNITFTVAGAAQTNYEFVNGDIPKLTTITYA